MSKMDISKQITFLHTHDLKATWQFYTQVLSLSLARDQGTCLIFRVNDAAYLGFCEHIEPIEPGRRVILTLVSDDVEGWYEILESKGVDLMEPPKYNPKYQITHFFLKDPNGYWIEIQRFENPL